MNADLVHELWRLFEARDWDAAEALLAPDFVCEWPHSGERMRGAASFVAVNREYPEGWSIRVRWVIAQGDQVVSEVDVVHGEKTFHAASFFTVAGGKLARATEYWVEAGHEAPPAWRARWTERM